MSKRFDMSDEDIKFYTKQLELLVEAVMYDLKNEIHSIDINQIIPKTTHTNE